MKELPRNTAWITLNDLALGTTEEDLRKFLCESGIELPIENVSVNDHRTRSQGGVALRNGDVAKLLHRAILDRQLNGVVPTVVYKSNRDR
jgi:hypothetical protein